MATTFSARRLLSIHSFTTRAAHTLIVLLVLAALAPALQAAPINYGDFVGNTVMYQDVTESSITDPIALFGPPSVAGDQLNFSPVDFLASGSDGAVDQTVGVLKADLVAAEGQYIDKVTVEELFSFDINGDSGSAVSIAGLLVLVDLTPGHGGQVYQAPLLVQDFVGPPYIGPTFGTDWLATAVLNLAGLEITHAAVTFNDILQASSRDGVTAWIEKTDITLRVDTPEPGSLALLAAGMTALVTRRRVV